MIKFKQKQGERDSEAGFTLLEVIAAVSILTVGLLAVASMQTAAIQGNDKAYRVTEGATWAQNQLESLMGLSYDNPLLDNGTDKTDPTLSRPRTVIRLPIMWKVWPGRKYQTNHGVRNPARPGSDQDPPAHFD